MKHLVLFEDIPKSVIEKVIDEYIRPEDKQKLIKARLIDERTYEDIAAEFGYSVRYTYTLIYKLEERVFRHLW